MVLENIVGKIHVSWNHVDDVSTGRPLIDDLIEAETDIDEEKKELKFSPSEKSLLLAVSWLNIPCSLSIGYAEQTGYTFTHAVYHDDEMNEHTTVNSFSEHEEVTEEDEDESANDEDYIAFFVFSGLLLAIILLLSALICVIVRKNKANYEVVNANDSQIDA